MDKKINDNYDIDDNNIISNIQINPLEISHEEIQEQNIDKDNIIINDDKENNNEKEDNNKDENNKKQKRKTFIFKFYSGILISMIYLLISLFTYSYLNLVHIFLSFYFIYLFFNFHSENSFILLNKALKIAYIIQFCYIIIKGLLFIIYKLFDKNNLNQFKIFFEIFNISFNKINYSIFEMGISLFDLIILLLYYSINNFHGSNWKKYSNYCIKLIKSWKGNENSLLSVGLYLICLGTIFQPSIIHTFFLFIILLHLSSLLFNLKFNHWLRKKISKFFIYCLPIYFLENYLFNCPNFFDFLLDSESYFHGFVGIIYLFDKKNTNYNYFKNWIFLNIIPFILFYFGFCLLVFFVTIKNNKVYNLEAQIDYINKEFNESFENMNESIDVAQGIIKFYIESKTLTFYNKIKLYIIKYCITPEFFLHLCRIGIIIWINLFDTYANVLFIIWIFLSIYMEDILLFLNITKYTIFPLLMLVFSSTYIFNIGIFNEFGSYYIKAFGLVKYEKNSSVFLIHMGLKITIITLFQIYIYIQMKYFKFYELHKNDIEKKKNMKEKELNDLIKIHFEGNYILQEIEIIFKVVSVINSILVTVFFYLSICQNINIFNEIILMFIFSLYVFSKHIDEYYFKFLVSINIIFILKYIVHVIYPEIQQNDQTTNIYNLLSLLFFDNLKNIHYSWIAFYFLYIEYCNSSSLIFQKCKSKTFSIFQLIDQNEKLGNTIKFILITICDFIFGIYIWLIIACFIICFSMIENNILFLFELFIIFIIYYKYIKIASNKYQNNENIFFYVWLLILSSIINFVIIYILQFLNKRPLSFWNVLNTPTLRRNLELFGLFLYEADYTSNLFPYMIMFIISIALYLEIDRQLKINSKLDSNDNQKNNNILFRDGSEDVHKNYLLNDEILKQYSTKIYYVLYYILHYYWIIIFIVVDILSIYWMLSISMFIEIFIFSFYIMKSFKYYYSNILSNEIIDDSIQLYNYQKKNHFKTTHSLQEEYFNLVWKFNLFFISLSYLSNIVLKFYEDEKDKKEIKFLNGMIYIFGFYCSYKSNKNKYNFISYSFGYFLIIGLFSIRAYFVSKFEEIKVKMESAEESKKLSKRKRGGSFDIKKTILSLDNPEENVIPNMFNLDNESNNKLNESSVSSINDTIDNAINDFEIIESKDNEISNDNIDNNLIQSFNNKYRHSLGTIISKDSSSIKYVKNKMIDYSISFQKAIKAFIEVIIIALILFEALLKVNIISFILLFFVIYTYIKNELNTQVMFYISSLVLFLFNLQYLLFVSNISYNTNPFKDNEIMVYLKEILKIPWYYEFLGTKWGFFLSCGVYQYQIRTLWIDVIILIILYFYLEFFSFSLYEKDKSDIKFNILYDKYSKKFADMKFLTKEQYESFIYDMKFSYNINLKFSISNNLEEKNSKLNQREIEKIKKGKEKTKKNKEVRKFKRLRNYFFLVLHQIVLVIILIISSQNRGLISLGYMGFSIYYIYYLCDFLAGKKWGLRNGIKNFIKPYFFFDLLIQFIFQIPLDFFKTNSQTFDVYMNILGFEKLVDFNSKKNIIKKGELLSLLMKIFCYFLLLLQEKIYSSYEFKKYILKYHYEYMNQAFIIGKCHSFLFNNHRIKLMEDKVQERLKIEETLDSLKEMIENWNDKTSLNDTHDYYNNFKLNKKKSKKITIGNLIRKHWLVKYSLTIYYASRKIDLNRIIIKSELLNILQGNDFTYSELEEAINKFENENNNKFDLNSNKNNIEQIVIVKENLKKNEEEQMNLIQIDKNLNENNDGELINSNIYSLDEKKVEEEKIKKEEEKLKEEENILKKKLKKEISKNNENESDLFFPTAEYYEKKHEIRSLFFKKYYSKGRLFIFLIKASYKYIIENFEYVCYFFMVINNFAYGSLISIFWTILVFLFGITQYPRPKKKFWKFCLVLSSTVIFIKFTVQLKFIDIFLERKEQFPYLNLFFSNLENKNSFFSRLGIKRFKENQQLSLIYYLMYDFFILGALLINQFLLIKKGLWYKNETVYETIEEANKRIQYFKSKKQINEFKNKPKTLEYNDIQIIIKDSIIHESQDFCTIITSFINENFNYIRNEKPGMDFYLFYTIFQILIIMYIIVFYTDMEQDKFLLNDDKLQPKQFSSSMIIVLFIHLILCVFDRYIYLKNTRKIKKIKYKIYDKETGNDITKKIIKENPNLNNYDNAQEYINNNKEKYKLISYQYEGIQYSIIIKFILQIITVISVHIFIFWYLPLYDSNKSIIKNINKQYFINELLSNNYTLIFYILYCFYFTFSGLQIKYGLAGMRKVSPLMAGSSMTYNIIYKSFKAIPFLFELKNFIDWSFTPTALEIWQWLKFEEINGLLFINKCFNKSYMGRRIGSKRTLFLKISMGWSLFFFVLAIMFGPLVLFSSLNPSSQYNFVNGIYMKVEFHYNNSFQSGNLTLLESTNLEILNFDYDSFKKSMNKSNQDSNTYFSLYKNQQIQNITIKGYGDFNWDISPKSYESLYKNLNDNSFQFYLRLTYSFSRKLGKSDESLYRYEDFELKDDIKKKLNETFKSSNLSDLTDSTQIYIEKAFSKFLRIPSEERPVELINEKQNIILGLKIIDQYNKFWYIKSSNLTNEIIPNLNINNNEDKIEGIQIITFSDTFSKITFGYNVLTFYMAFVLLVGNYLRTIFLGSAERVIYTEMVLPNKLLNVCEGIRISRIKKDYLKEEQLYYLLIDLMRSPEIIKSITKSSLAFIQEKNIINQADLQKKIESSPINEDFNSVVRKSFQRE